MDKVVILCVYCGEHDRYRPLTACEDCEHCVELNYSDERVEFSYGELKYDS